MSSGAAPMPRPAPMASPGSVSVRQAIAALQTEGIQHYVAGRHQMAREVWIGAVELARDTARARGLDDGVRYLCSEGWTNGIGHIALLDFFAKRKLLGLDRRQYLVKVKPQMVANPFYLNLWCKYFEMEVAASISEDVVLRQDWPMVLELDGEWWPFMDAVAEVERRWCEQDRAPLLALPGDIIERGWRLLGELGIPRDGWFVTLHLREDGMVSGTDNDGSSIRNCALVDYRLAIAIVIEAGGHVVRIGKRRTKDVIEGLVDLGGSLDWLDVFLLSQCRFLIGCNSGPAWVSGTFGVKALLTNWAPIGTRYGYAGARILPKQICRIDDGVIVALTDDDPIRNIESAAALAKLGLAARANNPGALARETAALIEVMGGH